MISGISIPGEPTLNVVSSKSPLSFKLSGPFWYTTVTLPKAVLAAAISITNSTLAPFTLVNCGKKSSKLDAADTLNALTASGSKSGKEAVGNANDTSLSPTPFAEPNPSEALEAENSVSKFKIPPKVADPVTHPVTAAFASW